MKKAILDIWKDLTKFQKILILCLYRISPGEITADALAEIVMTDYYAIPEERIDALKIEWIGE